MVEIWETIVSIILSIAYVYCAQILLETGFSNLEHYERGWKMWYGQTNRLEKVIQKAVTTGRPTQVQQQEYNQP